MVSISTAKAVLFTVAPLLLPRLISWYRARKVKDQTAPVPVIPITRPLRRSLNILFFSAVLALATTLPKFGPENIFAFTASRIQTPNDVLFNRLAQLRGPEGLTANDQILKPKIASLESRCLYFVYGPDVLTHCPFCISDDPMTYLYFALPKLLLPHFIHVLLLGVATSGAIGGRAAGRWRLSTAVIMGAGLALLDVYAHVAFDFRKNMRVFYSDDYTLFYWKARIIRGIGLCLVDITIAALIYLSGTNRLFVLPPTSADRTEAALRLLDQARGKVNAMAVIRNAVVRDENLRRKTDAYWFREGKIINEVMDEREVVEGIRSALTSRVQVSQIEEDARKFADSIITWTGDESPTSIEQ